jgi:hypothetical protein
VLRVLAIAAMCPGIVWAEDWVAMAGAEIPPVLTEWLIKYEAASQRFYPSGRTLYDAGQESWGSWEVRGDQYCSQWPPAGGWACYDMFMDTKAGEVRFVGESGALSDGALIPLQ